MTIRKVKYLENGYFSVLYSNFNTEIIQDITAIKMQFPTDEHIKDILMFLRRIKLEKLTDKDFDELKYRNHEIVVDNHRDEEMKRLKQLLAPMSNKTHYTTSTLLTNEDLDSLLG